LPAADTGWMDGPPGESSASVRVRVGRCRQRQSARQGSTNAALSVAGLEQYCVLDAEAKTLLKQAMQRWSWSARVVHRVLRVAQTLADLGDCERIGSLHIAEAIQYRQPWGG